MDRDHLKTQNLTWEGRYGGGDITVPSNAASAINLVAKHMAMAHFVAAGDPHPAAVAHHLHSTEPKLWEKFKGEAVMLIQSMHGSGEKGLGYFGAPAGDSKAYFDSLHDLATELRRR